MPELSLQTAHRMLGHYQKRFRKKKTGGIRVIYAPDEETKAKQRQLLMHEYLTGTGPGPFSFAFARYRGIKEHASAHVGKGFIIRMDIKDFFPSITAEHLVRALEFSGLTRAEIETRFREIPEGTDLMSVPPPIGLAQMAFLPSDRDLFKTGLAQGGCLAGWVANVVSKPMIFRMISFLRKWGPSDARLTVYADDIVISSNDRIIVPLSRFIRKILKKEGFEENRKKFRVMRPCGRQIVCGVVVNAKPNPPKEDRKKYRGWLHRIYKQATTGKDEEGNIVADWNLLRGEFKKVEGYFSFARHISPEFWEKYKAKIEAIRRILMSAGSQ